MDTHCHVFNGTDLQVKEFVSKVFVNDGGLLGVVARAMGALLEDLAWSYAPTGNDELAELARIENEMRTCTTYKAVSETISKRKDAAYQTGKEQLQIALHQSQLASEVRRKIEQRLQLDDTTKAQAEILQAIDELEPDRMSYQNTLRAKSISISGLRQVVDGLIAFILQNFNYRYINIYDYLDTYNRQGERVVDLIMPSIVDFDFWLAKGSPTLTPLITQAQVMEKLSVVTNGRVHGFIPFDPLRQVAFKLNHTDFDAMSLVRKAIEKQGFIGVKLYPPMGFAPLGNEAIQKGKPHFWKRDWLPAWVDRPDIGRLLDKEMRSLFTYCAKYDIPIMAHTSLSNGAHIDFKELAGSMYWEIVLAEFNNLRVNFGHFGDTSIVDGKEEGYGHAEAFAKLMNSSGSGQFAYADAGFFTEVLARRPALRGDIQRLYDTTNRKGDAALANRFLYGTDWEMSLTAGPVNHYLAEFVELFKEIQNNSIQIQTPSAIELADKFFGQNAATFAGLRKGEKTRARLDSFYARNNMGPPDWLKKLDGAY
jgi:predicted TIM-barrel fold metal-dependent hydrolase